MTSPPLPSDPPMLDTPHPGSSDSYHLPMPPASESAESAHRSPPPPDPAPAAGFRRNRFRVLLAMVKRAETKILGLEYTVVTVDGYIQNLRDTLMPATDGFGGVQPVLRHLAIRGNVNVARGKSPRELCTEQVLRMENDEDVKVLEEVVEDLRVYEKVEEDLKALEEAHNEAVRLVALGSSPPPPPPPPPAEKRGLDSRCMDGQVDGSDDSTGITRPVTKKAKSQVVVGGGETGHVGGSVFVDGSVDRAGTLGVARPQTVDGGEGRYNLRARAGEPPAAANANTDGGPAAAAAKRQHAEKPQQEQQQQQQDSTKLGSGPDRWAYEAGVGHSTFSSMRRDGA